MATVSNDVDEIRRQMAMIRRAMHEDVKDVVESAEAAADWHRYIMMYPWVSLGVAVAVGYVIVPRRHKTADALAAAQADLSKVREAVEKTGKRVVESARAQVEPAPRRKSIVLAGLGLVTPMLLKAAQSYALKYLEQWILQQQNAAVQTVPSPSQPGYPGGAAGQGGTGPGRPPTGPRRAGGPGMA